MALRRVVKEGEECLRKVCKPVDKFDQRLSDLIDDMAETMKSYEGAGLAACQVGILKRVVVINTGEETGVKEFINPEIIFAEGEQKAIEGCLSCPGKWGYTLRPAKARVKAQDRKGEWFELEGEGLLARAFCHEIDHLNGQLFMSKVVEWYEPEDEDKRSVKSGR